MKDTMIRANEAGAAVGRRDASVLRRAAGWPAAVLRGLVDVYRAGLTLPVLAPAIFAIAVLPEAAQHVAEIQLGMFTSREAFIANSAHPIRMAFGALKVAGLLLCVLAAARFVHIGTVRGALRMPWRDVGRTVFALAVGFLASLPTEWATRTGQPPEIYWPVMAVSWATSFVLIVYLVGALLGDREMTLKASFTRGWRAVPALVVLGVAAFWPASMLHSYAHTLAIGAAPAFVWALMTVDALLVGLLATLLGSALAVSYRMGGGGSKPAA